jgi:hypothetical protein
MMSTQPPEHRDCRRSGSLRGLVVLNLVLLAALAAVTFMPDAHAQARSRANYTMVAGGVPGAAADVVWIVDSVNQQVIAISWEPNKREMIGIGGRSLARDLHVAGQGGATR